MVGCPKIKQSLKSYELELAVQKKGTGSLVPFGSNLYTRFGYFRPQINFCGWAYKIAHYV